MLKMKKTFYDFLKKVTLFFLFSFSSLPLSSQTLSAWTSSPSLYGLKMPDSEKEGAFYICDKNNNVPLLLEGIWKNRQRYIVFDTSFIENEDSAIAQIVLRTFYTWYDDRAAEAEDYTKENPLDKNNTTFHQPQKISFRFIPLTNQVFPENSGLDVELSDGTLLMSSGKASGAWDLEITYPGWKESFHVPLAVIGDSLYLDFLIKETESIPLDEENYHLLGGFWRDYGRASGILVSPPVNKKELLSLMIQDDCVYEIRYWESVMDYEEGKMAVFSDGDKSYYVPKQLAAQGRLYTCVNGKGTRIRNITKTSGPEKNYTLNEVLLKKTYTDEDGKEYSVTEKAATIMAFGEPYMVLEDGSRTMKEIIEEDNRRKKPVQESPFPPHGILDFDWSIIEDPPSNWNKRNINLGK